MSFKIQVFNAQHKTVSGTRVTFAFTSLFRGMSTSEYTDGSGIATFNTKYDDGKIEVYVDGRSQGECYYKWGQSITVNTS